MRVLFLTLYPPAMPSSRLRVYQYLPYLRQAGIDADVLPAVPEPLFSRLYFSSSRWAKAFYSLLEAAGARRRLKRAGAYDALVIQKALTTSCFKGLAELAIRKSRNIFYDFDDHVLHQPIIQFRSGRLRSLQDQKQNLKLVKAARMVFAGSAHLQRLALEINPNTIILPTPVDTQRFIPAALRSDEKRITLGWMGQEAGLTYLESLAPVFSRLAAQYPIQIKVISRLSGGRKLSLGTAPVKFVSWNEADEVREAQEFDIGLMPVLDDAWGAGKCGLKLLQYMALGVPGVASRVGANKEIISEHQDGFLASSPEEWEKVLSRLIESPELRHQTGQAAREKVEARYSLQALAPRLAALLRGEELSHVR